MKVGLTSTATTVDAGSAAMTITATVTDDSKNAGVTFTLSPSTGCGSIPASSTGMSVVYTPQPAASLNADCTATITATSVSTPSKSTSLSLTVKAITVSFVNPPTNTTLTAGASAITLTAAFAHDTATDTVKWSMAAGCGTLAPSGLTAVYTPPSSSLAKACTATIAAASTVNPNLSASQTASITFTVNPIAPLAISTTSLPGDVVGTAYSQTLKASGGTTPYKWSGTSLPTWLNLSTTGTLSGTPTAAGTFTFSVTVTDSTSPTPQSQTASLSIVVTASVPPLAITTTSLPAGVVSTDYDQTLAATGGTAPYSWAGTSMPGWLALSSSGVLTGTPTAAGTFTFSVTVTDSSSPAKTATASLSVTVTSASSGTGLSGRYAFSLLGYSSSGMIEAAGSFTADGKGGITGGSVDFIGAGTGQTSITPSGSSYSVGSDNRGSATIVTPLKTLTIRFALESNPSGVATEGSVEEWESGSGAWIAIGQILQQTVPTAMINGQYTFLQFDGSLGVAGAWSLNSGTVGGGEYDSIFVGGTHTSCSSMSGSYSNPDANGRFTSTTTCNDNGESTTHAYYAVSANQYLEITSSTSLIGIGQLQSGPTLTNNSNLVFYATGVNSMGEVQLGLVNITGSSTLSATTYKNDMGTWDSPKSATCNYAIDSWGKVTLTGSNCGSNPPIVYLTGPDTGVLPDTGGAGQVLPQTATSLNTGTYYFGMLAAVSDSVETEVGVATVNGSTGVVTGTSDETSLGSPEQAAQPVSYPLSVNSGGTLINANYPGQVSGIVISPNQFVIVDNQTSMWPTLLVFKTVPEK